MRPADGLITIDNSDGYKSAGLYDAQNRQVAWLFNMLPLAKGNYRYWLPACDWQGRAIPAGKYSLRVSEADLSLKYVALGGNDAVVAKHDAYSSTGIDQVVFDSKDRPIFTLHWSESYRQFRAMDNNLQHERWMIPGCAEMYGATSDGKGFLYSLREADKDTVVLSRIDEETGKYQEVAPGEFGWYLKRTELGFIRGVAVLDNTVYLASYTKNCLLVGPTFATELPVNAPGSLCAGPQRKLLWIVSNREAVVALNTDGTEKYRFTPDFPGLLSLAVNGNRMALLSPATGKVYQYDISNPAAPKLTQTIGTGDGPFGPIRADRFQFQQSNPTVWPGHCKVALDSTGTLAVTDKNGVKLFNADGTLKRSFEGIWGQYIETGAWQTGEPLEIVDLVSLRTMKLDEKTGVSSWGITYGIPPVNGYVRDPNTGFFFIRNGVRFGAWPGTRMVITPAGKTASSPLCLIVRYTTDAVGTPVLALGAGTDGRLATFRDFNKEMNDITGWEAALTSQGKSLPGNLFYGGNGFINENNGDIVIASQPVTRIPLKGIDAQGVPVYDFDHFQQLTQRGNDQGKGIISPYDLTTREEDFPAAVKHAEFYPDGTLAATCYLKKTGHGSGLCNWSGTEVAGYDATGVLRWLQPMANIKDTEGTRIIDDVSYTVACPYSEVQILDKDGMYLGISGVPRELYWEGMWLDNTHQFSVVKGNTGKHYVVFGNFNDCTVWWMEVQGRETIKYHVQQVDIDAAKADALTRQTKPVIWRKPANTTTQVKISKLAAPLPIDGDMLKWRQAVPTPQIIITPETGEGINGPADGSALIRLAYGGKNLYVQLIRFDDLVTMHQPLAMFYKQDGMEMAINSYTAGIKINVTHTRDAGDVVYRDGWFLKAKELDRASAPRSIIVLPNAKDISERKLIEQVYGVDLSNSKVVISEFIVPLDAVTFEGRLDAMPTVVSGATIALGLAINDNDSPGADLQKMMVWPATYGTFNDKSCSAVVVFE